MHDKIIFLDIDGVLNNRTTKNRNVHGCIGINVSLTQIFKRIIKETGAKVVLSSTWRLYKDLVKDIENNLCPEVEIVGQTPDSRESIGGIFIGRTRGDEIKAWIDMNGPVSNFAIIDDTSDMGKYLLTPNFFKTEFDIGLTEEIADQIIKHLNKGEENPYDCVDCKYRKLCYNQWGEEYEAVIGTHHCRRSWEMNPVEKEKHE